MYLEHFGLSTAPFSIATDPRFLYLSDKHREALAHLIFSTTQTGGFVVLTGEIGAGKTTLCRHFLDQVAEETEVAFVFNPRLSATELLAAICREFHIDGPPDGKDTAALTDALNQRLLSIHAGGKQALLVIDEAQNLAPDVLEQVRLLTNLETTDAKLLQIILVGQPQLQTLLSYPELTQLNQRVVARYHLATLNPAEVHAYVRHRLAVAGSNLNPFSDAALDAVAARSGGVPRLVNVLCDRALLGAYVSGTTLVTPAIVDTAAREVFGQAAASSPATTPMRGVVAWVVAFVAISIAYLISMQRGTEPGGAALSATTNTTRPEARAAVVPPLLTARLASAENRQTAFETLLSLWAIDINTAAPATCQTIAAAGYACHSGRGPWNHLERLNLPAVLVLQDRGGTDFHATLTDIERGPEGVDRVALMIDGARHLVTLEQLAFYWTGRFTVVWHRPPLSGTGPGKPEYRLPQGWLDQRLGGKVAPGSLRARIREFQVARGLPASGTLGSQTLIALSAEDGHSPQLRRHAEATQAPATDSSSLKSAP